MEAPMLDVVNQLLHGFVSTPVTIACRQGGLFKTLASEAPLSNQELASRLGANPGPLAVAVRLFRSLRWLSGDAAGRLSATPLAASADFIPVDALSLYAMDFGAALAGSADATA